jgi:hypothetical protein
MRLPARSTRRLAVLAATGAALALAAPVAQAQTTIHWAPVAKATVHPGVKITIADGSCMAGFVLTDGSRVFLAVPASCTGVSVGAASNGCRAAQYPIGLTVAIQGARYKGRLVYSSWTQMQRTGATRDANRCRGNDLSLIRLDNRDIPRTNPSVPALGGPSGVSGSSPAVGTRVAAYINGATQGVVQSNTEGSWTHQVTAFGAVAPTNTGSPVLTTTGRAIGMVAVVPQTMGGVSGVHDLAKELTYLHTAREFRYVHLANGTQRFVGP